MATTFDKRNPLPWFREQVFVSVNVGFDYGSKVPKPGEMGLHPTATQLIQQSYTPGPVVDCLLFPSDIRWAFQVNGSTMAFNIMKHRASFFSRDNGIRYLPWKPDHCTYMQLDGNARFAVTGPLSGCSIYVAGDPANPWFFHTNRNSDTSGTAEASKRKWPLDLIAGGIAGTAPQVVTGKLERADYAGKEYIGLVFGFKQGDRWQFYFHGNSPNGQMVKRIY